jgi:branched-chain amino acid transport system substrate-binding protein
VLTSQKVIELAGEAANGAVAHVGLTADAPQPDQGVRQKVPGRVQGRRATTTRSRATAPCTSVKVLTEKLGKVDRSVRQRDARREGSPSRTIPACCSTSRSTDNGDLDRESFMTKVVNGKQKCRYVAAARRK